MPSREDEYWAGTKEPRGTGLCPRCGSDNISYNQKFQSWRCNKCERSFPMPSYGPGGTPPNIYQKTNNIRHNYRTRTESEFRFPIKIIALILLCFACIGFIGWAGLLLYEKKITTTEGIVLIAVGVVILLWNIIVVRRLRIRAWAFVSILLLVALLGASVSAFAGVEPLSTYKSDILSSISQWGKSIPTINIQSPANVIKREYSLAFNGSGLTPEMKIYIEPTKASEADKIYAILLYKRGAELGTRYVKWDGLELLRLTVKTTTFYISESDWNAYFEGYTDEQISSVFTISIREATAGESYLINENYSSWDEYFAK